MRRTDFSCARAINRHHFSILLLGLFLGGCDLSADDTTGTSSEIRSIGSEQATQRALALASAPTTLISNTKPTAPGSKFGPGGSDKPISKTSPSIFKTPSPKPTSQPTTKPSTKPSTKPTIKPTARLTIPPTKAPTPAKTPMPTPTKTADLNSLPTLTLSWTVPAKRTDNTSLYINEIGYYTIHVGTDPKALNTTKDIDDPYQSKLVITEVEPEATYYFAIQVTDIYGIKSGLSPVQSVRL